MKKVILGLFLLFCIMFTGCFGPGVSDFEENIGSEYKVVRTSKHQVSIRAVDEHPGKPKIYPKVDEIAYNERYILVKRFGLKNAYPEDVNNNYEVPDENVVEYYILDMVQHRLYGPYTLDEFNQKKVELNISEELILKKI